MTSLLRKHCNHYGFRMMIMRHYRLRLTMAANKTCDVCQRSNIKVHLLNCKKHFSCKICHPLGSCLNVKPSGCKTCGRERCTNTGAAKKEESSSLVQDKKRKNSRTAIMAVRAKARHKKTEAGVEGSRRQQKTTEKREKKKLGSDSVEFSPSPKPDTDDTTVGYLADNDDDTEMEYQKGLVREQKPKRADTKSRRFRRRSFKSYSMSSDSDL